MSAAARGRRAARTTRQPRSQYSSSIHISRALWRGWLLALSQAVDAAGEGVAVAEPAVRDSAHDARVLQAGRDDGLQRAVVLHADEAGVGDDLRAPRRSDERPASRGACRGAPPCAQESADRQGRAQSTASAPERQGERLGRAPWRQRWTRRTGPGTRARSRPAQLSALSRGALSAARGAAPRPQRPQGPGTGARRRRAPRRRGGQLRPGELGRQGGCARLAQQGPQLQAGEGRRDSVREGADGGGHRVHARVQHLLDGHEVAQVAVIAVGLAPGVHQRTGRRLAVVRAPRRPARTCGH